MPRSARRAAVDGVEAASKTRLVLVFDRDSDAGVLHFEDEVILIHEPLTVAGRVVMGGRMGVLDKRADGNAAVGGEFDGVVDEVFKCEREQTFIAAEDAGCVEIDFEREFFSASWLE